MFFQILKYAKKRIIYIRRRQESQLLRSCAHEQAGSSRRGTTYCRTRPVEGARGKLEAARERGVCRAREENAHAPARRDQIARLSTSSQRAHQPHREMAAAPREAMERRDRPHKRKTTHLPTSIGYGESRRFGYAIELK